MHTHAAMQSAPDTGKCSYQTRFFSNITTAQDFAIPSPMYNVVEMYSTRGLLS